MRVNIRVAIIKRLIEINENIFFYPRLKRFYSGLLNKEGVIIDVCSNTGQSIDFFLSISNKFRIFGYEPNQALADMLRHKYHACKAIEISNKGLSDREGVKLLKVNILDLTSSFEDLNYQSDYQKKKSQILGVKNVEDLIIEEQRVTVSTLDHELTLMNFDRIELLKMDVEGHELNCLIGLSRETAQKIKYIQLEQHVNDMYLKKRACNEIHDTLDHLGFQEVKRIKHGFGGFYEIIFKNNDL